MNDQSLTRKEQAGLTPLSTRQHATTPLRALSHCFNATRHLHSTVSTQAVKPYLLADIGEGITECEVIQWFVEPGSTVAEFDKICEVQSDKASVEITSRFAGKVLKLHHKVNDIAKVGYPLVDIETSEEGAAQLEQKQESVKEASQSPSTVEAVKEARRESKESTVTLAAPAVRRIAMENKVDLAQIHGTGKDGRVLKEDVLAFVSGKQEADVQKPAPLAASTDHSEPLTGIQKAMFRSMTKSLSIPQLGYKDDIELNATTEYRAALNKHIVGHPTHFSFSKMSYLPIFVKCLSIALTHYPIMNASLIGDSNNVNTVKIHHRSSHNIGVAMDTPQGLIVPNIKDVQNKTIFEIAAEIHRLSELGKKNAISPADLQGGTITISNIGTIGGTYANPVIVSSELAIVALGRIQTLPRFDKTGNVVAKQVMPISWSADHRIIDGATIARFGNQWKDLIENPALLASELR
ncbi:hypothetical protein DFQ28_007673 [Apophysomyces sp. BC1034]|nr:hypothetical protein DFQ30_004477 [Apophysomyces sp. BC1015]KAG0180160.1 hypothetical protein DFQ29_001174 [Apophysomyces sp. BC1021]KAG0192770.1 hypothetical protein DFQ28_007673 [Apophysomyces sp. BC1034]